MRTSRLFVPDSLAPGTRITLPRRSAHYLRRVLRLRPGDPITVFNGFGGEFAAEVISATGDEVQLQVGDHRPGDRESSLCVTLGLGISRAERMDYGVQKAVELGVTRIQPFFSARCGVRLDAQRASQRLRHWRGIVESACEQCGRNTLPPVEPPTPLGEWLVARPPGLALVPDPGARDGLSTLSPPPEGVVLLVGPEGGLSDGELSSARTAGFQPVSLGPRTLRTETAAVAAVALVQGLWGDLAG